MRPSLSTVVTPAPDQRLLTLRQLKMEFDLRTDDQDAYLESKIDAVSDEISAYCFRNFGCQSYEDRFNGWHYHHHLPHARKLYLRNWPVIEGSVSVSCDGTTVSLDDLYISFETGVISGKVYWHYWPGIEVVVNYRAGWRLPGWEETSADIPRLPTDVTQAALMMILAVRQAGRISFTDRDPYVRSEMVEGAGSVTYSTEPIGGGGGAATGVGGMSVPVVNKLMPYKVDPRAR